MRHTIVTLAGISLIALMSGCSSLNPFAESAPKPAPLTTFTPSVELRTLWQARIGSSGPYVFQPAVVGEDVYAAAHDGAVARLQAGRTVWSVKVGKKLSAGVGSNGRLVAVVGADGEVVALDAVSGKELWRALAGVEVLAPPAVSDAVVVVRAADSRLIAFDAKDGTRRWLYQRATPPLSLRSFAGMAMEGGAAVLGYPGGKMAAVNLANGGALWELTVATPRGATELERVADVAGTPVFGRREVCAVAYQGRAACFDVTNGNTLWSRDFSSAVGMARDTRFVFITDDGDMVHGLDAFSGASVWKQDALTRRAVSRPAVVGDYVVVGDMEGYVHLMSRETGVFAGRARVDSSAIVADPQPIGPQGVVVQTRDGSIQAFEAR
jgi:outer membrane protein assembly factor BamB